MKPELFFKNVVVLVCGTLLFVLVFIGIGQLFGKQNLLFSLLVISTVLPLVFGYVTQKYLTGKSKWIPTTTLVIPVIPNVTMLIYDQIKTGWGPMDVPLSATIGFIFVQTIFVAIGAYARYRKSGFK